ncbi:MAG: bifunctional phosphopantothenoylcysteine decarboxylase/phosphopantothenate--cysteine ligase CoaBC [Phaeodactylibacter sp.]|uniref:bifunctional phosphopantothenoylcysteine decarboxylase/phosphopantothenate--cysteine ligase CoaBC n=1 Tax=Phaeodactylibacter sp. TaxID=1940289 RepID=UPI0032F008BF
MSALHGKKILLGITGSIAAYKAASLVRLLIKAGAEVQVLMTAAATDFITPLTLATLSRNKVHTDVASGDSWNNHVEMGLWADAMVLAPLTATTLAKLSHGICDNIIAATYLSARCPVFFAPAMDLDMWKHPATLENVGRLKGFGNQLIPVGTGELASGLIGEGRMAEPEAIVKVLSGHFAYAQSLKGKRVLVTAGPTYEPVDPVRFIGNRSSGKMGIAIADELNARGAAVHLVLGPSALSPSRPGVEVTRVGTAREMYKAATEVFGRCDAAVLAAAVADYRPAEAADQKIKKEGEEMSLRLIRNPDIAAALGQTKAAHQRLIGFALETQNGLENAKAKLARKNLDLIVLNSLADTGAGFNHDTNKITLLSKGNKKREFELKFKTAVAVDIVNALQDLWG